jgi:hypothetical protein
MSSDSPQPRIDRGEIRRRVEQYYNQRKEWFIHLTVYIVVIAVLWGLWLATRGVLDFDFPAPLLVMLGWGAGLAGHGVEVASHSPDRMMSIDRAAHDQMAEIYGSDWEATTNNKDYQPVYQAAHKRYRQKAEFAIHLAVYIVINLLMVAIWLGSGTDTPPFPLIIVAGWGIGLAGHAASIYFDSSRSVAARERAVQEAISRYNDAYEKPKKRKREQLLTDDGELLEVVEEPETEREKRLHDS